MKNIYLCGPVSRRPLKEVAPHFFTVEQEIRRKIHLNNVWADVSNPVRFCQPDLEWHEAMKRCIGQLVQCDGVALLRGWQQSRGATLELKLAQEMNIPVVHVEPPIDHLDLGELFTAAPEALRYFNARLEQARRGGMEEAIAEKWAPVELSNRFLDPHGFEYINITGEE
jgi:hypothetical protein